MGGCTPIPTGPARRAWRRMSGGVRMRDGPMRLDSLPEPDGTPQNSGGAAWVVILAVVIVAIAALVAMAGG